MSRPEKHKGEVVGGGKVRARLKWIDGPATFMTNYAASKPLQDYTSEDFKKQFRVAKREASAQWRGAAPRAGSVGLN